MPGCILHRKTHQQPQTVSNTRGISHHITSGMRQSRSSARSLREKDSTTNTTRLKAHVRYAAVRGKDGRNALMRHFGIKTPGKTRYANYPSILFHVTMKRHIYPARRNHRAPCCEIFPDRSRMVPHDPGLVFMGNMVEGPMLGTKKHPGRGVFLLCWSREFGLPWMNTGTYSRGESG